MKGKDISGFLEPSDLDIIRDHFSLKTAPTKSQIQLFFSEHLARRKHVSFSKEFQDRIASFDAAANVYFSSCLPSK